MSDLPRMRHANLACWLLGPWVAVGTSLGAGPSTPAGRPIVPGFERFYEVPDADLAAGGRLLMGELNCVACHRGAEAAFAPVARKQAPILDRVGSRVKADYLRAYLSDPPTVRPGATMPDLLAGLPKEERDEAVDTLVHFLASTGKVVPTAPNRKTVALGKTLYEQSGCAACHGLPGDNGPMPPSTVRIGDVGAKYGAVSLAAFLQDPLAVRPSGRMPALNLKPAEAQAIASYLLKDTIVQSPPNLAFRYYEGEWSDLPDFEKLTPVASGMAEGFDVGVARRHGDYALRFEGVLDLERAGDYTFHLASDDGSRLFVDGRLATDNDGVHPNQRKAGKLLLTKGRHVVVVTYFQGGGEEELDVDYQGPGLARRPLGPELLPPEGSPRAPERGPTDLAVPFQVDSDKARKGRALFTSIGCASCHQLKVDGQAIAGRPGSKPVDTLAADNGCLAAKPPRGVPNYNLSSRQRAALTAALGPEAREPSPKEAIHRTLVAFNCYACHARDGVGGIEEGRDAAFATTQKEMGDEGRVPPSLSGVGGKLTETWLRHILAEGAKDRPYMLTRMPRFGERNVGHLVRPLEALDVVAPVEVPDLGLPGRRAKATGRFIVGAQAFNCGSCHQFREHQAAGIQALDMTLMTSRLRREWFLRYVVDPPAFRPGTRMPSAWPGGKSQLDSIYNGDTARQLESVWLYLSDGPDAAVPYGVGRDPIPLVADKAPVIYRNYIQGAGPRAIGVGYPEKANLAFDANDLRLALIWQGAFIDASKHWTGRGEGFQGPLGDNVLTMPGGPSLAWLPDASAEWPRKTDRGLGGKFRGYRLDSVGRPAFLYEVGDVRVEDFPEAASGGDSPTIRRTLDLSSDRPADGLFFRAAVGKKIEPGGEGWLTVDGEWKVKISSDPAPVVRSSAGKVELVVPVKLGSGKARIVEEFAW